MPDGHRNTLRGVNHSEQPHRRIDRLTGRSVLLAPNRSRRPIVVPATSQPENLPPAHDPFLEGNEADTPEERLALREVGSLANGPGWLLRVVPNRYPAVSFDAGNKSGNGTHEVVIECPDYRSRLADLEVGEVFRVLEAWRRRVSALRQAAGTASIHVFRNEGAAAGASLPHCHSQILATDFVPQGIQRAIDRANEFDGRDSSALYQSWLNEELESGSRVVRQSATLAVVCPYASRMAWQVRIGPRQASDFDFCELDGASLLEVSRVLLAITRTKVLGALPGFNLLLTLGASQQTLPWMIDLLPRTAQLAGFELATDAHILAVTPESAAAELRRELKWPDDIGDDLPAGYVWQ